VTIGGTNRRSSVKKIPIYSFFDMEEEPYDDPLGYKEEFVPREVLELGIPGALEVEELKLGNINDEDYQRALKTFSDRQHGNRYQLFYYLLYEAHRRWNGASVYEFRLPELSARWPDRPNDLEKSFLTLRRPLRGGAPGGDNPYPLYRHIRPRLLPKPKDEEPKIPPKTVNWYAPRFANDSEEIGDSPSPSVPMEHSYELHMALREVTRKIWDQVTMDIEKKRPPDVLDKFLDLPKPILDRWLMRVVAQRTQEKLSQVLEATHDFYGSEKCSRLVKVPSGMSSLLCLSQLTGISPTVIDRVKGRLERIFPGVKVARVPQFTFLKAAERPLIETRGQLLARHFYREYRRSRGANDVPPVLFTSLCPRREAKRMGVTPSEHTKIYEQNCYVKYGHMRQGIGEEREKELEMIKGKAEIGEDVEWWRERMEMQRERHAELKPRGIYEGKLVLASSDAGTKRADLSEIDSILGRSESPIFQNDKHPRSYKRKKE
jgi:hypothetical protein